MRFLLACAAAVMLGGCVTAPRGAWEGKRIAVMGDSISDKRIDWWKHWWKWVGEDLGAEMKVYAVNGRQWNDVPRQTDELTADGGDVDAILVFMGTNDFNANVPLGAWWSESLATVDCNARTAAVKHRVPVMDAGTFRGRINVALDKLKRAYPDRQIVLMTPIRRGYFRCGVTNVRQDDSYANEIGLYLEDYVRAIREAGDVWSVPVIDTYAESGLLPALPSFADCRNRESSDALHPCTEGCRRLALTVAARLRTLPPTFRGGAKALGPESFKIMSFNVRHGEGTDRQVDLARIAQTINRARPRFAALQEIDVRRKRTGHVDQAAELGRLTGMVPTFAKGIAPKDDGEYGVMLLSEPTPLSVRRLPLPGKEPRVLLLCEFADCIVGTTHLSVATEAERVESVALIRAALKDSPKPVFLTGDWNATPDSTTLKGMAEFMTILSDTQPAGGTFHGFPDRPSRSKGKCLDYVAVDSGHAGDWVVRSAEVVDDRISSDHAPICVTVARKDD